MNDIVDSDALHFLASGRAEYAATADNVEKLYTEQELLDAQVWSVRLVADVLYGEGLVETWLPSWRIDEWFSLQDERDYARRAWLNDA